MTLSIGAFFTVILLTFFIQKREQHLMANHRELLKTIEYTLERWTDRQRMATDTSARKFPGDDLYATESKFLARQRELENRLAELTREIQELNKRLNR